MWGVPLRSATGLFMLRPHLFLPKYLAPPNLAETLSWLAMAARNKTPRTIVLDPSLAEETNTLYVSDHPNVPTSGFSEETDASLCPGCGEPLAWHDEACGSPVSAFQEPAPARLPAAAAAGLAPSAFAYALGQPVQPAPGARPRTVIWRGQVKARHPRTGWVHRVNVYRLDDGYWDCYHETELQAA